MDTSSDLQTIVDTMSISPDQQQQQPSDNPFFSKLSNQEQADRARALVAPIVHHMCATLIQKLARGMVARAAFASLKIEYYVSSKYIQAAIRGFLVRRRVAKMYWKNAASVVIQRVSRGMLARRLVRVRRHKLLTLESTIAIQKIVRGHFGRIRMRKVRHLFSARGDIASASDTLQISDFKELAEVCSKMVAVPSNAGSGSDPDKANSKSLTPLVLGLVRMLMLFTSDSDTHVDVSNVRWKEAANFLRCSVRLVRRMKKIALAVEGHHLRVSVLGNALLDAYLADREFHEETFRRLESGWKGATMIFKWITGFSVITRLQDVLPAYNLGFDGPFPISNAIDKREAAQDLIEESENIVRDEDTERRFVPANLVQVAGFPHHRPRPVLLVFASDVPVDSKRMIMDKLLSSLPGLFVVMNHSTSGSSQHHLQCEASFKNQATSSFRSLQDTPWTTSRRNKVKKNFDWDGGVDIAEIRNAVSIGYNVVLESDVGLTDPPQRKFLGAFSALKAAIQPSPLCILVKGSLKNRAAAMSVNSEPELEDETDSDTKTNRGSPTKAAGRRIADTKIKRAFESAAQYLFELSQPQAIAQMHQISGVESPVIQFIIVMEAVIILLTPTKRYDGPKASTSYVSWKLGRRLLGHPAFFHAKLQDVKQHEIARENLLALEKYLRHGDWPTRTHAHSLGPHGELLFALASWVEAIVTCAHLTMDCQGLAHEITRTMPVRGLFGNVVTLLNVDCEATSQTQDFGEASCVLKLMDAVLADVRVYRTCHQLDGRKCIVNVYHDCLRIFFSAYDPQSSWRWQTVISESDVDNLLAPNSIERGDVKLPPKTKAEMYDRLVQLCLLQAKQKISRLGTTVSTTTGCEDQQLVVRPRTIRLYRRAIQLSGYLTTVTISELSRSRVQVDAFVHNSSNGKDMRAIFSLESILMRMSSHQARESFVAPEKIPKLVLDRLHLFRIAQSLTPIEKCSRHHQQQLSLTTEQQRPSLIDEQMEMKLRIRTRETSTGRLLMRKAVRSPLLKAVWLCSVFETHATSDFRVEFYQPQTSDRFSVRLSQVDCEDFVMKSRFSSKTALQLMMKHFRFTRDADSSIQDSGGEDGDEVNDASVVGCQARRIIARFPFAIPFKRNPHHAVTKREVMRAYIQVERQQTDRSEEAQPQGQLRPFGLQYRICLPDTCEEQSLVVADSEIESYFTGNVSWLNATSAVERKRLSRELFRSFVWEPAARDSPPSSASISTDTAKPSGRVVAGLPSGPVEAFVSTRITGRKKKQAPSRPPSRIKRSPFTARGSLSEAPVLSSCVQLLDPSVFGNETSSSTTSKDVKRCYTYNSEEMVHKGSYRSSGVIVIVQVFMKAVIIDTLVPQIPVDRVKQEDSFVLTFNFYHPSSSSGATVLIRGRKDLREVVGPDQAHLIRASAIHELMQHIVERRTEVLLKPVVKVVHSNSFRGQQPPVVVDSTSSTKDLRPPMQLEINFQRDRLFAKQKVTPINQSFFQDDAVNTTKLIDKAPERGLKVLTRTRVVRGYGRVILTVFDVSFTRKRGVKGEEAEVTESDLSSPTFRVDAYIHETSSRLSLLVHGAEILYIVGDDLELLSSTSNCSKASQQENEQRRRQLAQLIIDHVGIEARHDGVTSDCLFITEDFTPAQGLDHQATCSSLQQKEEAKMNKRLLLFKTTRALGHDQILLSMYLLADCAIAVRCYEPRSSQSSEFVVQRETLSLLLGLEENELSASVLAASQIPLIPLMTHICSFVRIERQRSTLSSWSTDVSQASEAALSASLVFNEQKARDCRSRLAAHSGEGSESPPVSMWSGMAIGRLRPSYFAVRVVVLKSPTPFAVEGCEVLCSAYSPSTGTVATTHFTSADILTRLSGESEISSAEDLVVRVRERLHVELLEDEEWSGANGLGMKVSITLG